MQALSCERLLAQEPPTANSGKPPHRVTVEWRLAQSAEIRYYAGGIGKSKPGMLFSDLPLLAQLAQRLELALPIPHLDGCVVLVIAEIIDSFQDAVAQQVSSITCSAVLVARTIIFYGSSDAPTAERDEYRQTTAYYHPHITCVKILPYF